MFATNEVKLIEVDRGVQLAVSITGEPADPVIVFSNSLGSNFGMWDEVAERLAPHARLVRYDTRGHGRSNAPEPPYTIEKLSEDLIAILDILGIDKAVLCGISLGGLTAMSLGIHHAARVKGLILANTAANFPPASMWRDRAAMVRESGTGSLVQPTLERWVTAGFRDKNPARVAELADMIASTSPTGYAACCEVLATTDVLPDLSKITCPVRVIAGRHDPSTPPARSGEIAAAIQQAELVALDAAHISAVEAPDAFARVVRNLLAAV